jgi:hypothetical protein
LCCKGRKCNEIEHTHTRIRTHACMHKHTHTHVFCVGNSPIALKVFLLACGGEDNSLVGPLSGLFPLSEERFCSAHLNTK